MRGLLFSKDYRPLFSGHETFALRQLWLKKAFDAVVYDCRPAEVSSDGSKIERSKNVFADASAIRTLGVGKNMVGSIRHWAIACDVLCERNGMPSPSAFGR